MSRKVLFGVIMTASFAVGSFGVNAASKAQISAKAQTALASLYKKVPSTQRLGEKATAILVFPEVKKAGLLVGAQHGEGALLRGGSAVAYYSTSGASFGLQAGAQSYGFAMFFMNEKALQQLEKADGWEIGTGPSVVMIDEGKAKNITSTTMKDDIYAFVFGQKGLMAGIALDGSKITRTNPK